MMNACSNGDLNMVKLLVDFFKDKIWINLQDGVSALMILHISLSHILSLSESSFCSLIRYQRTSYTISRVYRRVISLSH